MNRPAILGTAGIGIVLFIAAKELGQFPFVRNSLVIFSCALLLAAVVLTVVPLVRRAARDPYDLSVLKEVHEKEVLRNLDPDAEVQRDFDSVVCTCCGSVYSNRLHVCPACRKSQ